MEGKQVMGLGKFYAFVCRLAPVSGLFCLIVALRHAAL
jgi:hypothetical protein